MDRTPAPVRVGRPRRFTADVERKLIMDAAVRVMSSNGYVDATVSDVLADAGVSTRAFYRHFASKDALVLALFRRDAESVGRRLRRTVDDAPTPLAALDAWVGAFLDLFYEPRRARRVGLFTSPAVRSADGYSEELARSEALMAGPLSDVVRRGDETGVLRSADPDQDAATMLAVATSVADPSNGPRFPDREDARAHIVRWCWPALAVAPRTRRRRSEPRP